MRHGLGESVYLKSRSNIDYSDAYKAFPFIDSNFSEAGYLVVNDYYHDTLFPYSELKNNKDQKVILDVSNGLSKTYIGSPTSSLGFKEGDPIFVYRKHIGVGQAGYKSCVTTFCMVSNIIWIKKQGNVYLPYDEFIKRVGNKSVYSVEELQSIFNNEKNVVIIELIYYGFFGGGNNINWVWLKNKDCWGGGYPTAQRLTRAQFDKILKEGNIDVSAGAPSTIWEMTKHAAGIPRHYFREYYKGRMVAIAYKLKNVIAYENPKELSDYGINHVPQSFIYVEDKQ